MLSRARAGLRLFPIITMALVACGGSDQGGTADAPPVITISGIVEGATYDQSVTILIAIDRGAFQALLDGQPFTSSSALTTPGAHTLTVTAQVGLVIATRTIHFTIRPPDGGVLIVRMLDLGPNEDGGGGDAILVTDSSSAGMVHALIDAGPAGANASDPGFVARQLVALHVDTLALLLLTHAHSDHYGGMPAVLSGVHVRRFLYNGQVRNLSSYTSVLTQAHAVADSTIVVSALRDYALGVAATPAHLTIVPPLTTYLGTTTDDGDHLNDGSVGARLQLGTFTMFFTGDGEVEANGHWRASFPDLIRNVTVLKVGHHGANNAIFDNGFSGTSTWLDQVVPHISIISGNGTSHPRINALARLLGQAGNTTYCTNVHGNITIRISRSGDFALTVARNAGMPCVSGSEATT